MNYTSDFESIAREALRVLLVIFVASYKNAPRALCRQTSALVEVRGDHIVAFRGLFWRQEAVPSAELTWRAESVSFVYLTRFSETHGGLGLLKSRQNQLQKSDSSMEVPSPIPSFLGKRMGFYPKVSLFWDKQENKCIFIKTYQPHIIRTLYKKTTINTPYIHVYIYIYTVYHIHLKLWVI